MTLLLPRRTFLQALLLAAMRPADARPRPKNEAGAPFLLEGGRILVAADFSTMDGGGRKALAFFNMGMGRTVLTKELHGELGLDRGAPLRYSTANAAFDLPSQAVDVAKEDFTGLSLDQIFAPRKVEAILSPSVLRDRVLVLDYGRRRLAIEWPGDRKPEGVAVPIDIHPETGLASVDVEVTGKRHAFVIDAGGGYSWMRGSVMKEWLAAAPDWRRAEGAMGRAEGAMGRANYNMIDFAFEKQGTLARIPKMSIGDVTLASLGVLGAGPLLGGFADGVVGEVFWDNWQKSAAKPVAGWLGANALQNFRLTIDYPARMSYWLPQSAPDPHDLDQPGLTLVRRDGRYVVGGLARHFDGPALQGVEIGDELIQVGALDARGASKEELFSALHGKIGETRKLTLATASGKTEIDAPVLDFS
jgi:hypothetical protein